MRPLRPAKGIYVGMLNIGAIIENTAFHTWNTTLDGGGARDWGPTVNPSHPAGLLWDMSTAMGSAEPPTLRPSSTAEQAGYRTHASQVSRTSTGRRLAPPFRQPNP
jgi:hypothetical protein